MWFSLAEWFPDVSNGRGAFISKGQAIRALVFCFLTLQHEGRTIVRNVGNPTTNETFLLPRRLESYANKKLVHSLYNTCTVHTQQIF